MVMAEAGLDLQQMLDFMAIGVGKEEQFWGKRKPRLNSWGRRLSTRSFEIATNRQSPQVVCQILMMVIFRGFSEFLWSCSVTCNGRSRSTRWFPLVSWKPCRMVRRFWDTVFKIVNIEMH
jgi:hypothetical protein